MSRIPNTDFSNAFRSKTLEPYSTLLHPPPLRFHCILGCWDRTQDAIQASTYRCICTHSACRTKRIGFAGTWCLLQCTFAHIHSYTPHPSIIPALQLPSAVVHIDINCSADQGIFLGLYQPSLGLQSLPPLGQCSGSLRKGERGNI